jgi:hypothetical protein
MLTMALALSGTFGLERLVTISARLQHAPAADRRSVPRRKLWLGSSLQTGDAVTIHDFSSTGMLIETAAELVPFDGLEIDLPEVGIKQAFIVWNSGRYYGCEFNETVSQATISAALLRSLPADPAVLTSPAAESRPPRAAEIHTPQDAEEEATCDDGKAPLGVRLRVILGSAIILWTLVIWGFGSLIKLIRGIFS